MISKPIYCKICGKKNSRYLCVSCATKLILAKKRSERIHNEIEYELNLERRKFIQE